jgi:hypothetical protein
MTENKQYTGRLASVRRWLDRVTEKHLLRGAGIVFLTGLLAAATAYSNASRIQVPVAGAAGMVQSIAAIAAVIVTLLGWILSSVIYHIGASVLGGKGSLNRMFALSGYASVPALAQQLLRFVNYALLNQSVTSSTGGLAGAILEYFNFFSIIGLILVGMVVMINYGLTGRKAAIVALLPTLISIAFALIARQLLGGVTAVSSNQGGGLFLGRRIS